MPGDDRHEFAFDDKAYIQFNGGNLVCRVGSKRVGAQDEILDSLVVLEASGTYDPSLKKWDGIGGIINWQKVGLNASSTFATLQKFELSLKASTIRVDTVVLTTPYFDKPILGMLTDRAFKINREEDKIYPQFLSFQKQLLIFLKFVYQLY